MKHLKVFVVEDQEAEAAYLKDILESSGYEVVGMAATLQEAIDGFFKFDPDICIIDIYLNGRPDGILFAEEINEKGNNKKPFVFLTSFDDNTTFRLAKLTTPYSYLLKPCNPLELRYAIELAMDKFKNEAEVVTAASVHAGPPAAAQRTIFIKNGKVLTQILLDEIRYIEVEGKYSKIVCNKEKFLVQQPLKELQSQLPDTQFSRIHRNYIVNVKEVTKIDTYRNEVFFKDGESLFFSRRYIDEFLHLFKVLK